MTTNYPTIIDAISQLRQLSQIDIQEQWQRINHPDDHPPTLNEKKQIVWPSGQATLWLEQKIVIPPDLHHYILTGLSLRLALTWWAEEAQIFVNGQLAHQGDLFDSSVRLLLTKSVIPNTEFIITLKLISPQHDQGALMRSVCIYETCQELQHNDDLIDPGFVADELELIYKYRIATSPDHPLLNFIASQLKLIDWSSLPHREKFDQSLTQFRQQLQTQIPKIPGKIHLLGHAHLDLAWLWPMEQTWLVAQNTFNSIFHLKQDFPELKFGHTTAAIYEWIEKNQPVLFHAIQKQVKNNHWELLGGMWVEPDLNLISGESIVRQILYGQLYFQAKFGKISQVAWLADTFGFNWQLPQLLNQGEIVYFSTQKLRWNDTTKFPHHLFWWEGLDGTKIFSFMSPPIGENIDPVKIINYFGEWQNQTDLTDCFWLPGVGDHGGGPTRDMLEINQRWQHSPFFPQSEFTTFTDYLELVKNQLSAKETIPTWRNELYLEFHRGCFTTHADQKLSNRRSETLLYQAELWSSLATITTNFPYPKQDLETAWKKVLTNQFHDILPGSSINQVYLDANQTWREVAEIATNILHRSIEHLASQIFPEPPPIPANLQGKLQPIAVFNSLNWSRSNLVEIPLNYPAQIYDHLGNKLPSQLSETSTLIFWAKDVPGVGWAIFWLDGPSGENLDLSLGVLKKTIKTHDSDILPERNTLSSEKKHIPPEKWVLENQFLQVEVDPNSGDIVSIYDKIEHREIVGNPSNQIKAYQDEGEYWDAWNIDPNYREKPRSIVELKAIYWVEQGEVRQKLRIIREIGKSHFHQDYILESNSPMLKISTISNWQEDHILVKTHFTFNFDADFATYEIPCGAIARTTKPQTLEDQAKWEIPALNWADLSTDNYGVSFLNDCKYGYHAKSNELGLTLLRSSRWPDPEADRGIHQFTYGIYPHHGNWQNAATVHHGYELNTPLIVSILPNNLSPSGVKSPSQLLDLGSNNLILMALKQSENDVNKWILRCYESQGKSAELQITSTINLTVDERVNLLENSLLMPEKLGISPWQIASFKLGLIKDNNRYVVGLQPSSIQQFPM